MNQACSKNLLSLNLIFKHDTILILLLKNPIKNSVALLKNVPVKIS